MVFLLFFLLMTPTGGGAPGAEATNQTAQVLMRKVYGKQTPSMLRHNYLSLPMFVDSDVSLVEGGLFSPAGGTGQEPLLKPVRQLLLPVRANSSPPSVSGVTVRTSCDRNMMQVKVGRRIFGAGEHESHLKLGSCQASKSTEDYLYFDYELSMCGTKRTMISKRMVYFNVLHYDPPSPRGPIRRTAPFSLPVGCYFSRYLYSYTAGYTPEVQMQKVFKETKEADEFVLTPRNARWEKLSPSDVLVLGEPVHFQAEAPSLSHNQRLYVHACFVTPQKSHTSTPRVAVVNNFGCVVKGEDSVSKFIPYKSSVVRFSVDSSLFKWTTAQQLYMHCTMSAGSLFPTPTAKSCNYDTKSRRWVELFGLRSVCDCCDSRCSSAASTMTQIFSSGPWIMEPKAKHIPNLQKKTPSSITTTTMKAASHPRMSWRSWPEGAAEILMGKVEKTVTEREWPFTGGGVMWIEEEGEEKQVKGSAVVEAEEELKVGEPHRIFEEIFVFDK